MNKENIILNVNNGKRDALIFFFFPYYFYLRDVTGMFSFVGLIRKTRLLRDQNFSVGHFAENSYLEESWK